LKKPDPKPEEPIKKAKKEDSDDESSEDDIPDLFAKGKLAPDTAKPKAKGPVKYFYFWEIN
jgi:hypothetical protein